MSSQALLSEGHNSIKLTQRQSSSRITCSLPLLETGVAIVDPTAEGLESPPFTTAGHRKGG